MALLVPGAHMQFANDGNGRVSFVWAADGNPVFGDDPAEVVLSLLVEAPWWADPLGKRTSLLPTVKTNDPSTAGRLQQYALAALQPAIGDGRLQAASVTVNAIGNGYSLLVSYTSASGRKYAQSIDLPI